MLKKKSMAINAGMNSIQTICRMIFPLITFPYITRVLGVENIGMYNFCTSVISYFTLIAGLGISTFAIREGSKYRDDCEKMSDFASEVFSINAIATVISYCLLAIVIIIIPTLKGNAKILFVLSTSIAFTTAGCEWIFNIYEDFSYIAIRSIAFQFISMLLMFLFVKSEKDVLNYAIITVVSSSGASLLNAFSRRRYCKVLFCINSEMKRMIIPILVLFANTIATTIYVNSDTTMVGAIAGNYYTGLYSVATRIYLIVKQVLSAMIVVSIPRLSALIGQKKTKEFENVGNRIINMLFVIIVPAMIGLYAIANNVVLILSGSEYVEAVPSLRILTIALFFSLFSWFYTSCVLIPCGKEKIVLKVTIFAAVANVILNLILIPIWKHNAAAFTTVIAEGISMIACMQYGKKNFHIRVSIRDMISVAIGCVVVYVICTITNSAIESLALSTILSVLLAAMGYFAILLLMKNHIVLDIWYEIKQHIRLRMS